MMTETLADPVVLTLTREFRAPPERVFDAWLDPARVGQFLFATPAGEMVTVEIDARVGGEGLIVERRGGEDARHRLRFTEIDRPHRLAFDFAACIAADGEWTQVSIDFEPVGASEVEPVGSGTRLTLRHAMRPAWVPFQDRAHAGWTTIFDSLDRVIDNDAPGSIDAAGTIRFERLLDASVARVWDYLVDDGKRAQWFAGGTIEPRLGGALMLEFDHDRLSTGAAPYPEQYRRYQGMRLSGEIKAWEPPHKLAFTWGEGDDVTTIELTPVGERTRLVLTQSGLPSAERRLGNSIGWHAHLAVLAARLAGGAVSDFWAMHAALDARYRG